MQVVANGSYELKLTVILPDPFSFHFLLSEMPMCCAFFLWYICKIFFGRPYFKKSTISLLTNAGESKRDYNLVTLISSFLKITQKVWGNLN